MNGVLSDDEILRMRAADAIEKATAQKPALLFLFKENLLRDVAGIAQMLPRLTLSTLERRKVVQLLVTFLLDRSSIVKTLAMQALADIAQQDARLCTHIIG